MTLQQFRDWAISQGSVGKYTDGQYVGECVSLINQYLGRVFGISAGAWGDAKDWNTSAYVAQYFDHVSNIQNGDIIVYGPNFGAGYGHIGIAYNGSLLDQNGDNDGRIKIHPIWGGYTAVLRHKGENGGEDMTAVEIAEARKDDLINIGKEVSVYDGASHVDQIISNIRTLQAYYAQRFTIQKQLADLIILAEDRRKALEASGSDPAEVKALQTHINELQSKLDQINQLSKKEI